MRKLIVREETFPLKEPFVIAHGTRYDSRVIYVSIEENGLLGEGESYPYERYGESAESVIAQIEEVRAEVETGISNLELQNVIKAGAARNALDLALWDLTAKQTGKEIWQLAGLPQPRKIQTAYTLVIGEPEAMATQASEKKDDYPILKLKLAGDGKDEERLNKIRLAAGDETKIVIDANESWNEKIAPELIKICEENKIFMIEQPFKTGQDEFLRSLKTDILICADESCHTTSDLENLVGKYDIINIKLDKAGGLTESLELYKKAREMNFKIMIGCMVTTSLGIRCAYHLAHLVDFVDIDGPILLAKDRDGFLKFDKSFVSTAS